MTLEFELSQTSNEHRKILHDVSRFLAREAKAVRDGVVARHRALQRDSGGFHTIPFSNSNNKADPTGTNQILLTQSYASAKPSVRFLDTDGNIITSKDKAGRWLVRHVEALVKSMAEESEGMLKDKMLLVGGGVQHVPTLALERQFILRVSMANKHTRLGGGTPAESELIGMVQQQWFTVLRCKLRLIVENMRIRNGYHD